MQLGFIGLGRMGKNMVLHLLEEGVEVVAWNRSLEPRVEVAKAGATAVETLEELVLRLKPPRNLWLMVTAGEVVDEMIGQLLPKLAAGDLVVDGGNSLYLDSIRRGKMLDAHGVHFMDVGTSGGIESARRGACLMVGGEREDFNRIEGFLKVLAAPEAYGLLGPVGAGHFAKMVHNAIEYGMMEAVGEGAAILKNAPFKYDLREVFRVYSKRSIIESRLVSWALAEFKNDPQLSDISSTIGTGGTAQIVIAEGDWTLEYAREKKIDVPVIEAAWRVRQESEKDRENSAAGFRNKVVSAIRGQFGQHPVKKSKKG